MSHRSRRVAGAVQQNRAWLQVEWLPAYAPELNPVEPLRDYLDDTALANTPMEDLGQLATPAALRTASTSTAALQWVAASFVTPVFFDFILELFGTSNSD